MKTLNLQNETYYTFNNETDRFEASGELTGDYTEINEFKSNFSKFLMISCNDTKEIFIIR